MADEPLPLPATADDTSEAWGWGSVKRITKSIVEVHKELTALRKENKTLREQVQTLADKVNVQAGHLAGLDRFIEAKVELEVHKRLDEERRRG